MFAPVGPEGHPQGRAGQRHALPLPLLEGVADFTYNTGRSLVPEPGSLALVLLAGMVGVSVTRRRSSAAAAA